MQYNNINNNNYQKINKKLSVFDDSREYCIYQQFGELLFENESFVLDSVIVSDQRFVLGHDQLQLLLGLRVYDPVHRLNLFLDHVLLQFQVVNVPHHQSFDL